jgi:multicomponent Na+:H+ antiporter subunit C
MNLVFALAAATLFGVGAYLVLQRDLVRLALGVVVVSHAAVLTLIASSLAHGAPPIYPLPDGPLSDPLSQAMALTAIVIGMAITALLLVLILRVAVAFGSDELEEVAEEEAALDERLEEESGPAHRDEEAAVR